MTRSLRFARRRLAAAAGLTLLLLAPPVGAQKPAQSAPAAEQEPAEDPPNGIYAEQFRDTIESVVGHIWTPRSRYTDGPYTRRAFRPVVAEARKATAQIRCGGKRVAYGGVVGPDGWVLTKASQLRGVVVVRLLGGDAYPARVVGVDRDYDLAMLKIDAGGLTTLDLNPPIASGPTHLVRADRDLETDDESDADGDPSEESDVVETTIVSDNALHAGDWVATVGYGRDPAAVGVVSVMPREIQRRSGLLGIQMTPDAEAPDGVRIQRVFDDTGASRAGFKAGDVITAIDGQPVTSNNDVSKAIKAHYPGDEVVVTVYREKKTLQLRPVLTGQVRDFGISRSQYQNSLGGELSERRFGFPLAMQHDSVLSPEECGGPLVNLDGRVVGFNISRAGRTETYALPTEAVRERLYDLMSGRLAPTPPLESESVESEPSDAG